MGILKSNVKTGLFSSALWGLVAIMTKSPLVETLLVMTVTFIASYIFGVVIDLIEFYVRHREFHDH